MNRSPELYSKIMTSVLVGTVTILSIIIWSLKEIVITDSFKVSIAVESTKSLPIKPYSNELEDNPVIARQKKFAKFANPKIIYNSTEVEIFQEPKTDNEYWDVNGQILQFVVLQIISQQQRTKTSLFKIEDGTYVLENGIEKPLIEMPEIPLKNFSGLNSNHFIEKRQIVDTQFNHFLIKGPKETHINIDNSVSGKYVITLEKTNYFDASITIEKLNRIPKRSPSQLRLNEKEKSETDMLSFMVTTTAKFDKLTSGNPDSVRNQEWFKWIFGEIKKQLADGEVAKGI